MRYIIIIIISFIFCEYGVSQTQKAYTDFRQPLDTGSMFNWLQITENISVSNNGEYVMYSTRYWPTYKWDALTIQSLNSNWKISLPGISKAWFTNDSRQLIYMQGKDTLCIFNLPANKKEFITNVRSFKLFMQGNTEWLACMTTHSEKTLLLQNMTLGRVEKKYDQVNDYINSKDGNILILLAGDNNGKRKIQWINLSNGAEQEIWSGEKMGNWLLNDNADQLAFMAKGGTSATDGGQSVWLYKRGNAKAIEIANNSTNGMENNMEIAEFRRFSKDGNKLFIGLKQHSLPKPFPGMAAVNIWSYADAKLQSQQLDDLNMVPIYHAVLFLTNAVRICRLQQDDEEPTDINQSDDFVLLTGRKGYFLERYWNRESIGIPWLVGVADGAKKRLPVRNATFSSTGKYLVGYNEDGSNRDLFIYEVATGINRNLTGNLPIPLWQEKYQDIGPDYLRYRDLNVAGWLPDDSGLLVCDYYDIWLFDPVGKREPVKLTNGRNQHWQFRIAGDYGLGKTIPAGTPLLLTAFNKLTKKQGFYQLSLTDSKKSSWLYMGDYLFTMPNHEISPVKARDSEKYIVFRESCEESPNIFQTSDFKFFYLVSDIYPEKKYNWFTSELINFKTSDGTLTQAILYKPGNFDPAKKYPLIIHYYDKKSDELHVFRKPKIDNGGEIDIAWFASHGYLVAVTDIFYKQGEPGQSVQRAIEGAALELSKRTYVDRHHIGIQGHSFGGWETNYLVTHSKLFAAAVSSCGISDVTSFYGNLWPGGTSKQEYIETRGLRMGIGTPWQNPMHYVQNSPVYYVQNVKTPVLMMANKNDQNAHFEEGLQFFTALRRAGKRAWMLEYDHGGHGVSGKDYKDYVLRMTQFFDHYLKGAPAPIWMTRGIPARMKGVTDGFELDNEIKTPSEGLLQHKGK